MAENRVRGDMFIESRAKPKFFLFFSTHHRCADISWTRNLAEKMATKTDFCRFLQMLVVQGNMLVVSGERRVAGNRTNLSPGRAALQKQPA